MENLNERLEHLKSQLEFWEAQSPRNQSKIDAIKREIDAMNEEIKQSQLNSESIRERATAEAANILDNLTVEIGGEKFTMQQLCIGDAEYGLLSIEVQMAMVRNLEPYIDMINGLEEEKRQLERQNRELQEKHEEVLQQLRAETDRANDAETKRDAAVKAKEEAESKHEKLRAHVATGATPASMEDLEKQREKYIAEIASSFIKIQSIEPLDFKQSQYKVVHLDGRTEVLSHLQTRKMKVATAEEVNSFRLQQAQEAAANAALPLVYPTVPELEIVTGEQFPLSSGDVGEPATSAEDGTGETGRTESVDHDAELRLTERIKALEARVTELELQRQQVA